MSKTTSKFGLLEAVEKILNIEPVQTFGGVEGESEKITGRQLWETFKVRGRTNIGHVDQETEQLHQEGKCGMDTSHSLRERGC